MADSKIDFSFENLHFSCEGDNAWVEKQLNNVLSRIPALLAVHRKGETIVDEEVIDIQEVVPRTARKYKPRKAKAVETEKVEVLTEPGVKAPKIMKTPKVPKEKAPKVLKVKVPKVPKVKAPKVPKEKKTRVNAKTKLVKENTFIEQTDSPLYQFILEKKAEKNQVRKFLVVAVFLAKSSDTKKFTTPMISRALKLAGLEKLKNASDCFNKNEKKGYCVKDGKEFFLTENGFLSVG